MGSYRFTAIILTCSDNYKKWTGNIRVYVLALLLFFYYWQATAPIRSYSSAVGEPVSGWLFPAACSNTFTQMIMLFGLVLLFCDAPFLDKHQPYLIVRSGRQNWLWGQIFYIITASALYFLYNTLLSAAVFLPHFTFTDDWGRIFYTMAMGSIYEDYGFILSPRSDLVTQYTPLEATLLSLLLAWLVGVLIGMVMFVLNLYFNRVAGTISGLVLVLLGTLSELVGRDLRMGFIAPSAWFNLHKIHIGAPYYFPSLTFILIVLPLLILVLFIIAQRIMRQKDIEVLPQL